MNIRFRILQIDEVSGLLLGYAKTKAKQIIERKAENFVRTFIVGDVTIHMRCSKSQDDYTVKLWLSGAVQYQYFYQLGNHKASYRFKPSASDSFGVVTDKSVSRLKFLETFVSKSISLGRDYAATGMLVVDDRLDASFENSDTSGVYRIAPLAKVVKIDEENRLVWYTINSSGLWVALSYEDAANSLLTYETTLGSDDLHPTVFVPTGITTTEIDVTISTDGSAFGTTPISTSPWSVSNITVKVEKVDETTNKLTVTYMPVWLSTPVRAVADVKKWRDLVPPSVTGDTWAISQIGGLVPPINETIIPVFVGSHSVGDASNRTDSSFVLNSDDSETDIPNGPSVTQVTGVPSSSFEHKAETVTGTIGFNTIRGGFTSPDWFGYLTKSVRDYAEVWDFPNGLTVRFPQQNEPAGTRATYEIVYNATVIRSGKFQPRPIGNTGSGSDVSTSGSQQTAHQYLGGYGITEDEDFDGVRCGPTLIGGVLLDFASVRAATNSMTFGKVCVVTRYSTSATQELLFALMPIAWDADSVRPLILDQSTPAVALTALINYIEATAKIEFPNEVDTLDARIDEIEALRAMPEVASDGTSKDRRRIALYGRHGEKDTDGNALSDIDGLFDLFAGEVINPDKDARSFSLSDQILLALGPGNWVYAET